MVDNANLDLSVNGSTEELNGICDDVFNTPSDISTYGDWEYNAFPPIGSTAYADGLFNGWQVSNIDVVDYWTGYPGGFDIVERWEEGVLGSYFPSSSAMGTPLWCIEPGKNFISSNRVVRNALDFLSQDEVTVLGLMDKYINEHPAKNELRPASTLDESSAAYAMKQICFWTFLETTRPYYRGSFTNSHGEWKTVHNPPVQMEDNVNFEGGGFGYIRRCLDYALAQKGNYTGYGKVLYDSSNSANQMVGAFICREKPRKTSLELYKTSKNPSLTQNNGNYSLKGAVYGVYRDRACKQEVGRITTDAKGYGKLSNIDIGTYYVKEIKAPPGYNLDPNVYTINCKL